VAGKAPAKPHANFIGYRTPDGTIPDAGDVVDHVIEHAMTLCTDLVPILRIECLARFGLQRCLARRVGHAAHFRGCRARSSSSAASAPKILRIRGGLQGKSSGESILCP